MAAQAANVFYLTGIQPSRLSQTYAIVTRDEPTRAFVVTSAATVDQVLDAFPGIQGVASYGKFYVTERALVACQGILQPGVTEIDVAREFERSVVVQGGVRKVLHVRFGRNGVAGMARETETRLERGDTVWFDVGCAFLGYCSDLAGTYSLGEPSEKARQVYTAMFAGEDAAISQARPGMAAGEVADLTINAVRVAGVQHYRRHHVGHNIGLDVYDAPLIAPGVSTPLEEGMIVNIETPYLCGRTTT